MKITITHRWSNACLWEGEIESSGDTAVDLGRAVLAARGADANLRGANLEGANLRDANLRGANLEGANLEGANLLDANLLGANLEDANLEGANLLGANLEDANLEGANLEGANLLGANLEDANLEGANLRGANSAKPLKALAVKVFSGLYRYQAWAILADDHTPWVRMGCLWKTVAEWDSIGIRASNTDEFPDDGSERCEDRVRAFEFTRAAALRLAAITPKKEA